MRNPNSRISTYLPTANDWGGGGSATVTPPATPPGEVPAPVATPAAASSPQPTPAQGPSASSTLLQYLYFLRFPLLGFVSLPLLCWLDARTGASALTRGIMTMSDGWQLFHATFFTISLLMTVLICAKNIVTNGASRFKTEPPAWLHRLLTSPRPRTMWTVLALAQLPALITLVYIGRVTVSEQTGWAIGKPNRDALLKTVWPHGGWHPALFEAYALGLVAAAAFWYLVSVFYYWTYPAPPPDDTPAVLAAQPTVHRPAVPLIFPVRPLASIAAPDPSAGWWTRLFARPGLTERAKLSEKPWFAQWLEWVARHMLRVTCEGYADSPKPPLYELHSLSLVSLGAILLLYLFLFPLVAPVVVSRGFGADTVFALLIFLAFATGSLTWKHRRMQAIGWLFSMLMLSGLISFFCFVYKNDSLHRILMETSFPTLGAILIILIFSQWLFAGVTFFLDRFRIPVLSVVLLVIFLPKLLPSTWVDQEHYFDAHEIPALAPAAISSPAQAIEHRMLTNPDDEPFVIVTAMGGGIQAAEWTAQVMARMESTFRLQVGSGYSLHDHLLLASGVSGGSVGLMPYMLEYTAEPGRQFLVPPGQGQIERNDLTARLTAAPGCSGLEAVAWGLEYYDLQRLLFTLQLSWLQLTHEGAAPDRTWALTQALNRNLHDHDCGTDSFPRLPKILDGQQMTLAQSAAALNSGVMPAFTFNTTVAETGDRFLLSNYAVPPNTESSPIAGSTLRAGSGDLPAESFLQAYATAGCCGAASGGKKRYADLSLATAARLSATFPVVSSGTRIPAQFAAVASHFLDGGYYDNDGTASAIEFLYAAMNERSPSARPLRILLVEIRDGDDLNPYENDDDLAHQTGHTSDLHGAKKPKPWSTFGQIGAPLAGMWNAGHKSTTRRNRRELCLLEHAYQGKGLSLHHVVFGIPSEHVPGGKPDDFKASPLSWKLTEGQKDYIRGWTDARPTRDSMADAVAWLSAGSTVQDQSSACTVDDQPN